MPEPTPTRSPRHERLATELDRALEELERAAPFAKSRHQEGVFSLASDLMDTDEGVDLLARRAPRFEPAGVFHGGPWEDPARLIPSLVGASLTGDGVYPTVEALSTLRIMALAERRAESECMSAAEAREFLGETSARNLPFLLGTSTEESRNRPKLFKRAQRLFDQVQGVVKPSQIFERVVLELELLAAQRPILTAPLRAMVQHAADLRAAPGREDGEDRAFAPEACATLDRYLRSMGAATDLSSEASDPVDYRRKLLALEVDRLVEESRAFSELLQETGLASPYHAVALRRLAVKDPARVAEALCASETGEAEARRHADLVALLIGHTLVPETHFLILGLARVLERSLLSRKEVAGGLRKIADMAILPDVEGALLQPYAESTGLTASAVLLGGCLAVLGLPLGIGQGNNPTCQSARGISLWSQHAPGQLLAMVASVARDGFYQTSFEGHTIRSDALTGGVAVKGIEADLDPVSQVLVPHLDRVYDHMMTLAALRSDDGHRWVNPGLYGHWIQTGFASVFALGTNQIVRHESFVRRFFATHHPEHNDGHELIYPNPVGIMVTDSHGRLLGRHAVSVQRIAEDPGTDEGDGGRHRVYFFNPNNEGRQDWGFGVQPTVADHGERWGESSLPFGEFASRLYAFHYDPQEQGDAFAVPSETVQEVIRAADRSWVASIP